MLLLTLLSTSPVSPGTSTWLVPTVPIHVSNSATPDKTHSSHLSDLFGLDFKFCAPGIAPAISVESP